MTICVHQRFERIDDFKDNEMEKAEFFEKRELGRSRTTIALVDIRYSKQQE